MPEVIPKKKGDKVGQDQKEVVSQPLLTTDQKIRLDNPNDPNSVLEFSDVRVNGDGEITAQKVIITGRCAGRGTSWHDNEVPGAGIGRCKRAASHEVTRTRMGKDSKKEEYKELCCEEHVGPASTWVRMSPIEPVDDTETEDVE